MDKLLKKYISILLESKELKSLEKKYAEDIGIKSQIKSNTGWAELDNIINEFKLAENTQYENLLFVFKDILSKNGYQKIGSGSYRDVYAKNGMPWIIKIAGEMEFSYFKSNATKQEYDNYFKSRNELYPKLYGYDHKHGLWIISEWIHTFRSYEDLEYMFPHFMNNFINACDALSKKYNTNIYENLKSKYSFSDFFDNVIQPILINSSTDFDKSYYSDPQKIKDLTHLSSDIEKICLEFIMGGFNSFSFSSNSQRTNFAMTEILKVLRSRRIWFELTDDLKWIAVRLKDNVLNDIHSENVGYRQIKDHSQPWQSFAILDYTM